MSKAVKKQEQRNGDILFGVTTAAGTVIFDELSVLEPIQNAHIVVMQQRLLAESN